MVRAAYAGMQGQGMGGDDFFRLCDGRRVAERPAGGDRE
jgi:hypothetical protein